MSYFKCKEKSFFWPAVLDHLVNLALYLKSMPTAAHNYSSYFARIVYKNSDKRNKKWCSI